MSAMEFSLPRPRRTRDFMVAMVNIVFLLLIFFLLTATVRPSSPFELAPPRSVATDVAETEDTVFLAADGRIAFAGVEGEAVYPAIADAVAAGRRELTVRADAELEAAALARVLARLGEAGIGQVDLAVSAR